MTSCSFTLAVEFRNSGQIEIAAPVEPTVSSAESCFDTNRLSHRPLNCAVSNAVLSNLTD
jgi:hypothetical protein